MSRARELAGLNFSRDITTTGSLNLNGDRTTGLIQKTALYVTDLDALRMNGTFAFDHTATGAPGFADTPTYDATGTMEISYLADGVTINQMVQTVTLAQGSVYHRVWDTAAWNDWRASGGRSLSVVAWDSTDRNLGSIQVGGVVDVSITEIVDTHNCYDGDKFTAPWTGYYHFIFQTAVHNGNGGDDSCYIGFAENGTLGRGNTTINPRYFTRSGIEETYITTYIEEINKGDTMHPRWTGVASTSPITSIHQLFTVFSL